MKNPLPLIEVSHLCNRFDNVSIHENISFDVLPREIFSVIGGSGSGKTTLLRCLLGLLKPTSGQIKVFGHRIQNFDTARENASKVGVVFQNGALFSSLSVLENLMFPLRNYSKLDNKTMEQLVSLKLEMVGLPSQTYQKYPRELSGGMVKRVAFARALMLDPTLLFLDEPSAGLDPVSAERIDDLILELRNLMHLTIVLVSHDPESIIRLTSRVLFLDRKKMYRVGTLQEVANEPHDEIRSYFASQRWNGITKCGKIAENSTSNILDANRFSGLGQIDSSSLGIPLGGEE